MNTPVAGLGGTDRLGRNGRMRPTEARTHRTAALVTRGRLGIIEALRGTRVQLAGEDSYTRTGLQLRLRLANRR